MQLGCIIELLTCFKSIQSCLMLPNDGSVSEEE